ncbi:hypothetical protein MUGA111182_06485 [Mucilaginibacter galii]|uniref:Uncharacterized protein n=1 Tax=Mucilaginibacter galii TaxID=2005073 RepID=A0A917JCR3_9SPHI|nr:hypothetical protein [Mucilaginibacter galii]GGI51701.1 hypothetical protein GCM10011425_29130 [Mucilaginibacter galii]
MKKSNLNMVYTLLYWLGITLLFNSNAIAQPAGTTNFYSNIKGYNLASLWHADKLRLISLKRTDPFPEPYGILGKNNQRFYIHYTTVTKDATNPYLYKVEGKTRTGNQVRTFTGTITVKQAGIFKPGNNPYAPEPYKGYRRGKLVGQVVLTEANTSVSSTITGELTTDFCINSQNQLLYDTLDFGMDGYANNSFTGLYKANGSKATQKLHYGDYDITGSEFSDEGGIAVPSQYEKYGWKSFVDAIPSDLRPASKAAIAEEKRQWWK